MLASWHPTQILSAALAPYLLLASLPPLVAFLHKRRWRVSIRDILIGTTFVAVLIAMAAPALVVIISSSDPAWYFWSWIDFGSWFGVFFISSCVTFAVYLAA